MYRSNKDAPSALAARIDKIHETTSFLREVRQVPLEEPRITRGHMTPEGSLLQGGWSAGAHGYINNGNGKQ
jgi:hypothetical protein